MKKTISLLSVLAFVASATPVLAAGPTIGTVSPTSATVNVPVTLSASVSDPSGVQSCNLYLDNDDKGAMTVAGGTASKSYVFTSSQVYTAFVFCRNNASVFNSGPNIAVWAQNGGGGGGGGDIVPPTIGSLSPASAVAGQAVTFIVPVSDAGGMQSCNLFIAGQDKGAMTVVSGNATKAYTFSSAGPFSAYVSCKDTSNNVGTGSTIAVSVSPAQPINQPVAGALVKLACPSGTVAADHPCKAVYYKGADAKRHAFPNEHVYFSWYADFNTVKVISSADMAAMTLGKNVTYRPGSRMVKFPSVAQVYVVAKGGVLRWMKTEADAKALYGDLWSKKVDDMSEAFFLDYKYGTDVSPSAPFDVAAETNSAQTIDQSM